VGDLEKVILRDRALAATVLKIANSALFGHQGKISTLSHAIVPMGYKTVQSLVISAPTETLYRSTNVGFKDKLLWEHALGVALAARSLVQECRCASVEEAFLGGCCTTSAKSPWIEIWESVTRLW
jgi:HD-like signal output (HDOD) protein